MIKSLLLIALRNLTKDRWYSILNILGLTIGITFSLFLIFYVKDELTFDRYNEKADRIYRIVSYARGPEQPIKVAHTQFPLGPTLSKDFPEVESSVRLVAKERTLFKKGNTGFYENKIYYADSTLFDVFTYKPVEGNPSNALSRPNSIVITKSLADKYFGKNTEATGKILETSYKVPYTVTAVIEDVPGNSHLRFDMLISASTLPKDFQDSWGSFNNFTYVLLKPGASVKAFSNKLQPLYDKYMASIFVPMNLKITYGVQPITDIHLHSDLRGEPEELGSMSYIWIFSAVAFFMLFIGCINYMNLTTARSARRAKEIGIRKVTGSTRKQLVLQFLSESVLTAFLALLLSVILLVLLLDVFNSLSGKTFTIQSLFQPGNILLLIGIGLITGLVGGSYPAFYLSGFQPVRILKGSLSKASGNVNLRRILVVVQFAVSMVMLISTWVVYSQLDYMHKKDLGFNKEQVMTIIVNTGEDERSKIFAMNNELKSQPAIKTVGTGYSYPGSADINLSLFSVPGKEGSVEKGIESYNIDEYFLETLGMEIIKGRNFSGLADSAHSILVNESMVKELGWDEPIGKRIRFSGDTIQNNYLEVVGVVKDFNQKSLYNPISPLILFYTANCNRIQLKLGSGNLSSSIATVEGTWKKYFPQLPFEYKFMDEDFNSQYAADQKRGKIFIAFSILTIIITFLGLLGLTAFTTQQKHKEISIRRVMGANVVQVVRLVSQNYLWLAIISAFIAFPVAYYFMHNWLQAFPYNEGLSVLPFIVSAFVIVFTAVVTAVFYAAKAALSNPVKSLHTE